MVFPTGYRRGLPITRQCKEANPDLVHMHWPEAYMGRTGGINYRTLRYRLDLSLALRNIPLVYTAHNILPHNIGASSIVRSAYRATLRRAKTIYVHSMLSVAEIENIFELASLPTMRIWHGDLASDGGKPVNQQEAREKLGLGERPVCLMFGAVEPYKGVEDVLLSWRRVAPKDATLVIAGRPVTPDYERAIRRMTNDDPSICLRLEWQSAETLSLWLSAADIAIFNYRRILTSGAASLARSWGLPIVLPRRLNTVELAEPNPRVFRFESPEIDLADTLLAALAVGADYSSAADWRELTSWKNVAKDTVAGYRRALSKGNPPVASLDI